MEEIKHPEPPPAGPEPHEIVKKGTDFDRSDPRTLLIAGLGIASVIGLIVIILGVQAYFDHITEVATYQKVLAPVSDDLMNLRSQEAEELNTYKYIDRNKGVVQIPISRAMELLAHEAAENKLSYFQKPTPVKAANAPAAAGAPSPGGAAQPAAAGPGGPAAESSSASPTQPPATGTSPGTSSETGSNSKAKM